MKCGTIVHALAAFTLLTILECKGIRLKRLGCYKDNKNNAPKDRPLPILALTYRDKTSPAYAGEKISWSPYSTFIEKMVCTCAGKVLKTSNGAYRTMGLQYYGECWTSSKPNNYIKDGATKTCVNGNFKECNGVKEDCIGKDHTNFVYGIEKAPVTTPTTPAPTPKTPSTPATPKATKPTKPATPKPTKATLKPSTRAPTPKPTKATPKPTKATPKPTKATPKPTKATPKPTKPSTPKGTTPKPGSTPRPTSGPDQATSTVKRPPSPTDFPIPCIYPHYLCKQPTMPCNPPCQPATPQKIPQPVINPGQQVTPCGFSCPAQCAPKCASSCCQSYGNQRPLPFGVIPQAQPVQPAVLSQVNGCRQGCSQRCAPQCTTGCCRWFARVNKKSVIIPSLDDN